MTSAIGAPPRAPFTQLIVDGLRAAGLLVGDHDLPPSGGWQTRSSNAAGATYTPFVVVSAIVASHSSGPLGDTEADWQLPYMLESFGGSRLAAEGTADRARLACRGMLTEQVEIDLGAAGTMTYGFQQIRVDSMGNAQSIESVQPPVWRDQSSVTLWAGKEL